MNKEKRIICLIDTSAYLSMLKVPGFEEKQNEVHEKLTAFSNFELILPFATILETARHISQLPNGYDRRTCAQYFVEDVRNALNNKKPYFTPEFPKNDGTFQKCLDDYKKLVVWKYSLADVTILNEKEIFEQRLRLSHKVVILTLDGHLTNYNPQETP